VIRLLIYGKGDIYHTIKKLIDWERVSRVAFVDSYASENRTESIDGEEVEVIPPSQIMYREYDYILCASIYEDEMRRTLKKLQIPEEKIISGKLEWENMLEHSFLFNLSHVSIYQNGNIEKAVNTVRERNRFCDIRRGAAWIDEKLSVTGDGAWAVSYDYLSVLCRVLQIMTPEHILEMGLGQSSKMIMSYQRHSGCSYKVIEQDVEWYNLFKKENKSLCDQAQVFVKPVKQVYHETYGVNVTVYGDISDVIADEAYDVIFIDGPWGSDGISRVDILPYIPRHLKKSWCIIVDDYGRDGEKNMIYELEHILKNSGIHYLRKVYGKYHQFCLLTSEDNRFLCSLF
jgi:hypothetical protein